MNNRNKSHVVTLIYISLCIILVFMCGCGRTKSNPDDFSSKSIPQSQAETDTSIEIIRVENTAGQTDSTDTSDNSDSAYDDNSTEPEFYTFLDVFRNENKMEINKIAARNKYWANSFTYSDSSPNGEKLVRNSDITEYPDSDHTTQSMGYTGIISYDDEKYTSRFGIDVSKFQGDVDWQKVANSGVDFAFVRIGYRGYGASGSLQSDKYYKKNIEGAQNAGLDVGVYLYSQAVNEEEAIEEADFVLSLLDGYTLTLPVVYDPEHVLNDTARTDNVSGEQFTRNAVAFCETITNAGLKPMVYANMLWEAYELDMSELSGIPMWYADYELLPQSPYDFDVWQYSQSGHIPGINGAVDLNVMFVEK